MGKEDYVSLEVARLLKEKGFDKECEYYISANTSQVFNKGRLKPFKEEGHEVFLCPTLYEAQKWLRERHNIDVLPTIRQESSTKDYCCYIYKNAKVVRCKVAYGEDFYECFNDGILEALKLI